ncbi:MAG: hypothetical protein HYZ14_15360 [Bacteroidetes bacterium]|nr:hypothetical protein [Bacteroidota bacterium]
MKALKYIVIGGLVFLGGRYFFRLNRAGEKAVVQASGKVKKVTMEGVVLDLKFNIKNPTATDIEMAAPLIKLLHNKSVLASSSLSLMEIPDSVKGKDGRIRIKPYLETGWINTSITLPFLSLASAGGSLLTRLKNKLDPAAEQKTIAFEVETNSSIFTKVGSYPYDDVTTLTV